MRLNEPITDREIMVDEDRPIVSRTDAGGRITFVNQAFIDVSGFEEAELIGQPHNIVRHPHMPKPAFADLWRAAKRGDAWTGLVKYRTKLGDYYWVRANVSPIYTGDQITGYISIRSKPTRAEVEAATKGYALFQNGQAQGLTIEDGRIVKDSAWRRRLVRLADFRVQIYSAVVLLVLTLALTIGSGAWALNRLGAAMDLFAKQSEVVVADAIPLLNATKEIRFDVVQIQQWLTDVSTSPPSSRPSLRAIWPMPRRSPRSLARLISSQSWMPCQLPADPITRWASRWRRPMSPAAPKAVTN